MEYKIAVVSGDGIGPEIIEEAKKVLIQVGRRFGHHFEFNHVLAGGCAIDAVGECLPRETVSDCRNSDSVLLGAVGGPKWDGLPGEKRPEKALLGLRQELGLYANLRPALLFSELSDACPLKPELVEGGLDLLVVRELTGGIYFGEKGQCDTEQGPGAYDVELYTEKEVERIARFAFSMAMKRNGKLTSVDKANVLESSRLWRRIVNAVSQDFPKVELSHMYVDNAAMQLIRDPKQFDVIVTSNMFGDILSDEASMVVGSIGLLPSASIGEGSFGMYEPIHGSAPDLAGKDIANPIATILSAAMMLRYSFGLSEEADAVEAAVKEFLQEGYRTQDIMTEGMKLTGTREAGDRIAAAI
ncbi:MAG: 3-isopropylmalate dehydrogenase [Anaerovoracaceae bacterium]|jgi:3-isopropylmalate dehydrogenase